MNSSTKTLEPRVQFHGVSSSIAIRDQILRETQKLQHFGATITSAQVVVEATHRHQGAHPHFQVKIELHLPHKVIVVDHAAPSRRVIVAADSDAAAKHLETDGRQKDLTVVVHDAFHIARRRLEDAVRRALPTAASIRQEREP